MIDRLYKLKKMQTDQKMMEKSLLVSKIEKIDYEISFTINQINSATVNKFGAISDFMILTIHKNTMKEHIKKLNIEKNSLINQVEILNEEIIKLQKESEQFKYILEEEKKENFQKILKSEQDFADEFMQSRYNKV